MGPGREPSFAGSVNNRGAGGAPYRLTDSPTYLRPDLESGPVCDVPRGRGEEERE